MAISISIPDHLAYGADEAIPPKPQGLTVDDAIYHMVHGCPGGVRALASRMGMSSDTLTHKASVNNTSHFLRPAELGAAMHLSGNYGPLHALAETLGYTCMPGLPDQSGGNPVEVFMRYQQAIGRNTSAVADALMPGVVVTNAMNRHVRQTTSDLIAESTHMSAAVAALTKAAPQVDY